MMNFDLGYVQVNNLKKIAFFTDIITIHLVIIIKFAGYE
jgi:hypothetical protein